MHKKFEEFVLAGMGRDSMEKVVEWDCPGDLNLEALECGKDRDDVPCALCWGHAMTQWIKGQPIETTTEAPTEEGYYWAREKSRKTGKWGEWQAVRWEREELHTIGWDVSELWHSEWWERSVERVQMPGVSDGE
jgi:hypothetical protein